MKLDESQAHAVINIPALRQKVSVLTGHPGTGKTTVIKVIVSKIINDEIAPIDPSNIFFCSPTGKAAKVLNEALMADRELYSSLPNKPATIHRMLGCQGREWLYSRNNPLPAELVVVDESSMLDSPLMARLFYSTPPECRFIFCGDADQLFPVGPGAPFLDVIRLNKMGVVNALGVNHRAAHGSLIAKATELIHQGHLPVWGASGSHTLQKPREDDLFFHEIDCKDDIPDYLIKLCRSWHKAKEDYIVLSPQHKGAAGIEAINTAMQAELNPPAPGKGELNQGWCVIRKGDLVINKKNNYSLNIFNGFTGVVRSASKDELVIDFDGQIITITDRADIKNIKLAYCISIHAAQGSEYKRGVLVCHSTHSFMLSRPLFYVGVSRFREELHVVGDAKGVRRAVKNNIENSRQTFLKLQATEM